MILNGNRIQREEDSKQVDKTKQILNYYRHLEFKLKDDLAKLDAHGREMQFFERKELNDKILLAQKTLRQLEEKFPICKLYKFQKVSVAKQKQEGRHSKTGVSHTNQRDTVIDFQKAREGRNKGTQATQRETRVEQEEKKQVRSVLVDTTHNKVIIYYAQNEQLEIGNLKSFYSPANILNTKIQFIRQILNINLKTDEQIQAAFDNVFDKFDPAVLCAISKSKDAKDNLRNYYIALRSNNKLPFELTYDLYGLSKNQFLDDNTKNTLYYISDVHNKVSKVKEGFFSSKIRKFKNIFFNPKTDALPETNKAAKPKTSKVNVPPKSKATKPETNRVHIPYEKSNADNSGPSRASEPNKSKIHLPQQEKAAKPEVSKVNIPPKHKPPKPKKTKVDIPPPPINLKFNPNKDEEEFKKKLKTQYGNMGVDPRIQAYKDIMEKKDDKPGKTLDIEV